MQKKHTHRERETQTNTLYYNNFGNVKCGFAHCGLCRFDSSAIPSSIFEATEVFQKPFQADINTNAIHEDNVCSREHPKTVMLMQTMMIDEAQLSQGSPWQSPGCSSPSSGTDIPTNSRPSTPSLKEYFYKKYSRHWLRSQIPGKQRKKDEQGS